MSGRTRSWRAPALALVVCVLLAGAAAASRSSLGAPLDPRAPDHGASAARVLHPTSSPTTGAPTDGVTGSATAAPSATPKPGDAADPTAPTASPAASTAPSPSAAVHEPALAAAVGARQKEIERLARKARAWTRLHRVRPVAEFTVANFNVQGASHRGNVPGRTRNMRDLLLRHGVAVASLQEFARSQRVVFDRIAGGTFAAYPGTTGRSLDAENSVVWRRDTFELVQGETRPYRYFRGSTRHMPRVLLRHRRTGVELWVTSYHNPASCCGYGNAAGYRAGDVAAQAADANALRALTKRPLLVMGDMNDRATYFCGMASRTGMHSADGSSYDGGCRVAGGSWIDWILGTDDVVFSGYHRDRSGFVRATSDHPIVVSQVKVTGQPGDGVNAEAGE